MSKDNIDLVTREHDGEKPTYEELEIAYIKERRQREALEQAYKQTNNSLAKLRYEVKQLEQDNG